MTKGTGKYELWLRKTILNVSWTENAINDQPFERENYKIDLRAVTECRNITYMGHVLRNKLCKFLYLISMVKIIGHRRIGRRRITYVRNIQGW